VTPEDALKLLRPLAAEIASFTPGNLRILRRFPVGRFNSWKLRTASTLAHTLGANHHLTVAFQRIPWGYPSFSFRDTIGLSNRRRNTFTDFRYNIGRATGFIESAIYDIEFLRDNIEVAANIGIDPELWEHVASEVQQEAWGKVSSQAAIFTEDRIRKWAGRPVSEVGKDLAVATFGKNGKFQLGATEGESQGWQLLAQGIAQAVRNVAAHRIEERPDHKRYAVGILGACSLLLTQMRFEHENSFKDTSPTPHNIIVSATELVVAPSPESES
jgi:hypothetical protein